MGTLLAIRGKGLGSQGGVTSPLGGVGSEEQGHGCSEQRITRVRERTWIGAPRPPAEWVSRDRTGTGTRKSWGGGRGEVQVSLGLGREGEGRMQRQPGSRWGAVGYGWATWWISNIPVDTLWYLIVYC